MYQERGKLKIQQTKNAIIDKTVGERKWSAGKAHIQ